jgi:[protein-PII] uridylyltransferase
VLRHISRQATVFHTPTQINLSADEANSRSVMELTAADRPGLLCDVGKVLMAERVELHAAKIMTVGERAEDVFYVTDLENRPLSATAGEQLREQLMQALDQRQASLRAATTDARPA